MHGRSRTHVRDGIRQQPTDFLCHRCRARDCPCAPFAVTGSTLAASTRPSAASRTMTLQGNITPSFSSIFSASCASRGSTPRMRYMPISAPIFDLRVACSSMSVSEPNPCSLSRAVVYASNNVVERLIDALGDVIGHWGNSSIKSCAQVMRSSVFQGMGCLRQPLRGSSLPFAAPCLIVPFSFHGTPSPVDLRRYPALEPDEIQERNHHECEHG